MNILSSVGDWRGSDGCFFSCGGDGKFRYGRVRDRPSSNFDNGNFFFVQRFEGPLVFVGLAIVVFQFFGPFLALLSGKGKRTPHLLIIVAAWIFFFRTIDVWWQVVPFFKSASMVFSTLWIDLSALLFVGGVWMIFFVRNFKQAELLPLHDTRLQDTKLALEAH